MKFDTRPEMVRNLDGEQKAMEALTIHGQTEKWIKLSRKGTKEENIGKGIDIVVETTDLGKLFLQIKNSSKGKEKFCKKKHQSMIKVVVIEKDDDDLELIWQKLRDALFGLRAEIRASWKERNYEID